MRALKSGQAALTISRLSIN